MDIREKIGQRLGCGFPGKTGPRTKINCAILPREEQDDDSL